MTTKSKKVSYKMSYPRSAVAKIKEIAQGFFTEGHSRSIEAKKNIIASFLIKGISIGISLLLVPMTINYVNPTRYGIWLTLSSIITWFTFFDIGFGHGLRNRFAQSKALGDFNLAKIYVSTTYAVLAIIFTTVWLLFIGANFFIDWSIVMNVDPVMASELSVLALVVFTFFCIQMVLKTLNMIFIADQKPAMAGFHDMLSHLISALIIFVLIKTTQGSLVYLAVALGLSQVLVFSVASFIFFRKKYREFAPSLKKVEFTYARSIMSLGVKFFLIQISAIVIFQTTNIVITQVMGPTHVTVYNIAFKYFSIISMSFSMILTPYWSAFTEAYTKEDYGWMRNSLKNLKKIWLYSVPVVLIMLLLSNIAYRLWIGDAVVVPFSVSLAMAVYMLVYTRFNVFIYLINGIGKVKLQLYINVILCVIYIPMAVIAGKYAGIAGIIGANILVSVIHAVVSQVQIQKLLTRKASGIWEK